MAEEDTRIPEPEDQRILVLESKRIPEPEDWRILVLEDKRIPESEDQRILVLEDTRIPEPENQPRPWRTRVEERCQLRTDPSHPPLAGKGGF